MGIKHLKPIQAYKCPKNEKLITDSECEKCPHFKGAEWEDGQWTVFCDYEEEMTNESFRYSEPVKTGHRIVLTRSFKHNPICPYHGKRGIIREPYDEIGATRWFCIDCIAKALYETSRENYYMKQILKRIGKKRS